MTYHGSDERFKNETTIVLIPEKVSECSLVRKGKTSGTCLSDEAVAMLSAKVGIDLGADDAQVMSEIKMRYRAADDQDLLRHLPDTVAKKQLVNFKVTGPVGVQLLSNTDIDLILNQWATVFPKFYAYNFNMLDYTQNSFRNGRVVAEADTLATVNPADIFKKYDCCACVINSDHYSGQGKHWMALFADNRGTTPTVEFFNSSGRTPAPEWISWLERTERAINTVNTDSGSKKNPAIVSCSNIVQQFSMTECGVYSLFYIWARLNKVPDSYFCKEKVPDELMFEFRAHLYDGYMDRDKSHWSYDIFKKQTKVKWDSESGHNESKL